MSDSNIRMRIFELESALKDTGNPPSPAPEMLDAANALRLCDHFARVDSIKSELVALYAQYSASLEGLVAEALQIQKSISAVLQKKKSTARRKKVPSKKKPTRKKPARKTVRKKPTPKRKVAKRKTVRKKSPPARRSAKKRAKTRSKRR